MRPRRARHRPWRRGSGLAPSARSGFSSLPGRRPEPVRPPRGHQGEEEGPVCVGFRVRDSAGGGTRPMRPRRSRHRPWRRGSGLTDSARSSFSSLIARRPEPVQVPSRHSAHMKRARVEPWPRSRMVPEEGLEPSRPCGHGILSPARLPVPPLRRKEVLHILYTAGRTKPSGSSPGCYSGPRGAQGARRARKCAWGPNILPCVSDIVVINGNESRSRGADDRVDTDRDPVRGDPGRSRRAMEPGGRPGAG